MPTVTNSMEIAAPRDTVWALLSDTSRTGEWNVTHSGFPDGPPQLASNATYREKITIMGMPGEASWKVVELDAPNRVVLEGSGPMGVVLGQKIELAGNGTGTTVTLEATFEGGVLAGPMGATVAASAEKASAESLGKLRDLIA